MKNALEEMKQLVEVLNKHSYAYYVLDSPTVSDKEYDELYDKLVKLEEQTSTILLNSPTQRVGDTALDKFKKVVHKIKLYSLNKAQTFDELEKWYNDIKKLSPESEFTLSYKFDGLTIVCEYDEGTLIGAYTRGNGTIGEDVTLQVRTIQSVPLTIDFKGHLFVQGEGIMTLSNLEKYNKTATEKLKNARNAASGGIRNLDPKITRQRMLDVVFYNVIHIEGKELETQIDMQQFLKDNNFYVTPFFEVASTFEGLKSNIEKIDEIKNKINFLIDGVVINLNNIKERQVFGYTSKFPKWAIAFKFEAMEASTILKEVVWQVGRTGKVTPTGLLEPVLLAGATVQRATLNNIEDINKKNLFVPSRVFIRRSNEVIPEILSLAEKLENSKEIIPPKFCPSCGSELISKNMNLYCENKDTCKEQMVAYLVHFANKDAMNLEGLSEQTFYTLLENFAIDKHYKLYTLTKEQLLTLEGFKEKKANNVLNTLKNSKKVPLNQFIYSLGILNVGQKSAKDLAKNLKTFENIKNASYEQLLEIRDIGEITAQTIIDYFKDKNNLFEINKLFEAGVVLIEETEKEYNTSSPFYQKTVVLTGTFSNISRTEATLLLEKQGASVTSSVSSKTDFVIYGENAGSKLDKAKQLGVATLEHTEVFGKMI